MSEEKVLIVGYGSIGKRHAANLKAAGISPYVFTRHPDASGLRFTDKLNSLKKEKIKFLIISSPTADHAADLEKATAHLKDLRIVLIEKPVAASSGQAMKIKRLAEEHKLTIFVGYNLRFLDAFDKIRQFVRTHKNNIRTIDIVAGQDLKKWRPQRKLIDCYSAYRDRGGGVDLDLSHEIDYLFWLVGDKFFKKTVQRSKISNLKIDSPDIFKATYSYKNFIADVTLDYIRNPAERYLRIICEDAPNLTYDFLAAKLTIGNRVTAFPKDDICRSYKRMLNVFLGIDTKKRNTICSLKEGLSVLRGLGV